MNTQQLFRKAVMRSAWSFLIVGAILFIAAGSLHYWQAWLFFAVFAVLSAQACRYMLRYAPGLLEKRIGGPLSERSREQRIIQCLSSVFVVCLFALSGRDYGTHGPRLPWIAVLAADCLVILGHLLFQAVVRENRFAAATVEVQEEQTVIDTGPYLVVRHPMYTSAILIALATPPALASLWGLLPTMPFVAAIIVRLLREERYLRNNLPGYEAYCARVRFRLIPQVW